jgi:hypothetical protein
VHWRFIILVVFLPNCLFSQRFSAGFNTGVNFNKIATNTSALPLTKISGIAGYLAGLRFSYQLRKRICLNLNPDLISKNHSQVRTDTLSGIGQNFKTKYLQISVSAGYTISLNPISINIRAGFFWSYWISKWVSGSVLNIYNSSNSAGTQIFFTSSYDQQLPFDNRKDNRFEFGLLTVVSVSYHLKTCSIFVEPAFFSSVTDQQAKYMHYQNPRYNQTLCLSIGFSKMF